MRLLSSLRFGVTLVGVILLYASVMSAIPQLRGAIEMTEMQAFRHWLFFGLIALLCVSVTVATFARIRFTLINAGVLTVHAGLLLLCVSSIWYFGTKIEGDVQLRAPRVEVISVSGASSRVIASFLPQPGEHWSAVMPMLGGSVALEVIRADRTATGEPGAVGLQATVGDNPAATIELTPNSAPQPLSERLALRLVTFSAERKFYDSERPALYWKGVDAAESEQRSASIEGLPLFCARYTDEGYALVDAEGQLAPTRRNRPALPIGLGLAIPTGWFEQWRMPIRVPANDLPFDVEITGFVPYIASLRDAAVPAPAESAPNPAVDIRLSLPGMIGARESTLFAREPAGSIMDLPTPVEFRWASSPEEREAWLTPLLGSDELLIDVKDPPVQVRVAVVVGQTIQVEGTSYVLRVQQLLPDWPLMSPGFEAARSPAALLEIESSEKRYTRTVIQRFPHLSQDIDESGMRRREGPYDPNLTLHYRTAANGWVMLIGDDAAASSGQIDVGVFDTGGGIERQKLAVGNTRRINLAGTSVDLELTRLLQRARRIAVPVIEPLERRQTNLAPRAASAVRLRFAGRGALAGWSESQWCVFSQYPHIDARPIVVQPPGASEAWEFVYSRASHDLGAAFAAGKLSVSFFPGRQSVESWRSDFTARPDDENSVLAGAVRTNETWSLGPWTFFQSGAAKDHWSYTILGVGNRRGIWPMVLGCVMITLGCLFAFYVKPVLRRRRQARALAEATARSASSDASGAVTESRELAGTPG